MNVTCPDGVTRAFHSNRSSNIKGFVYVGSTRIYGSIAALTRAEVGHERVWAFVPDASSKHGHLVRPSAAPSEQLDADHSALAYA